MEGWPCLRALSRHHRRQPGGRTLSGCQCPAPHGCRHNKPGSTPLRTPRTAPERAGRRTLRTATPCLSRVRQAAPKPRRRRCCLCEGPPQGQPPGQWQHPRVTQAATPHQAGAVQPRGGVLFPGLQCAACSHATAAHTGGAALRRRRLASPASTRQAVVRRWRVATTRRVVAGAHLWPHPPHVCQRVVEGHVVVLHQVGDDHRCRPRHTLHTVHQHSACATHTQRRPHVIRTGLSPCSRGAKRATCAPAQKLCTVAPRAP